MTLTQLYLDTPEIELFGDFEKYNAKKMKVKRTTYVAGDSKKHRTDSPHKLLPKLKNMSRCRAWKGNV